MWISHLPAQTSEEITEQLAGLRKVDADRPDARSVAFASSMRIDSGSLRRSI
jgi:hypothetical protein